jgi:DNA polymerase V
MSLCAELEPYALQVLGESMAPEFPGGSVVVVAPARTASDGAYVVAEVAGAVLLGRYRCDGARRWLEAPGRPEPLAEGEDIAVRGVVVELAPGRGWPRKRYPGDREPTGRLTRST